MFQSVSRHSNEQSVAHYSLRPFVSQLENVSDTISNWSGNHQPQRTEISTGINAPFIQNSNQMASNVDGNSNFCECIFQLHQYWRQHPSFSAYRGALMTKTGLTLPVFCVWFVDFAVRFYFCWKFTISRDETPARFSQVWQWCNFLNVLKILCCS